MALCLFPVTMNIVSRNWGLLKGPFLSRQDEDLKSTQRVAAQEFCRAYFAMGW